MTVTLMVFLPLVLVVPPQHGAGMTFADCEAVAALEIEWVRTWAREPEVCGVETVPQVSNLEEIGRPLGGNSDYVVFLNEPENPRQSDVPSATVAGGGLRLAMDTYPDMKFILPSATEDYRDSMLEAAGDIDRSRLVVGGHCYGWGQVETALCKCKAHADDLLAWADENGIDQVWIPEFGLDPAWDDGMGGSVRFAREMVAYYRQVGVERWAWFQVNATEGRWSTGEMGLWIDGPTELGETYKTMALEGW